MWIEKEKFKKKITSRALKISVIGLGYVGLNIACLFAKNGFTVYGFDIDPAKIRKLKRGVNSIPEEKWLTSVIKEFVDSKLIFSTQVKNAVIAGDAIFIAVPTPIRNREPFYEYILSAIDSISDKRLKEKLVILESTVPPGTTEKLVRPFLEEKSNLRAGEDFGLVFSPERIDPGNKSRRIWNIPKVVGGIDPLATELACFLYSQVIERVIPVSNPRTAELVKIMENTQRDVNLALTNLFAKSADKLGVDVEEVLNAAGTKWNFVRLKPGCGVGGECIGDVSYMASNSMKKTGIDSTFIKEARKINESMPQYTVNKAVAALKSRGKDIRSCKVAILGLAYKKDSSSIKNSPSLGMIKILTTLGAKILAYDPFIKYYQGVQCSKSVADAIKGCDCVIIATDHSQFTDLEFDKDLVVIDGRNILSKKNNYYGIGR